MAWLLCLIFLLSGCGIEIGNNKKTADKTEADVQNQKPKPKPDTDKSTPEKTETESKQEPEIPEPNQTDIIYNQTIFDKYGYRIIVHALYLDARGLVLDYVVEKKQSDKTKLVIDQLYLDGKPINYQFLGFIETAHLPKKYEEVIIPQKSLTMTGLEQFKQLQFRLDLIDNDDPDFDLPAETVILYPLQEQNKLNTGQILVKETPAYRISYQLAAESAEYYVNQQAQTGKLLYVEVENKAPQLLAVEFSNPDSYRQHQQITNTYFQVAPKTKMKQPVAVVVDSQMPTLTYQTWLSQEQTADFKQANQDRFLFDLSVQPPTITSIEKELYDIQTVTVGSSSNSNQDAIQKSIQLSGNKKPNLTNEIVYDFYDITIQPLYLSLNDGLVPVVVAQINNKSARAVELRTVRKGFNQTVISDRWTRRNYKIDKNNSRRVALPLCQDLFYINYVNGFDGFEQMEWEFDVIDQTNQTLIGNTGPILVRVQTEATLGQEQYTDGYEVVDNEEFLIKFGKIKTTDGPERLYCYVENKLDVEINLQIKQGTINRQAVEFGYQTTVPAHGKSFGFLALEAQVDPIQSAEFDLRASDRRLGTQLYDSGAVKVMFP